MNFESVHVTYLFTFFLAVVFLCLITIFVKTMHVLFLLLQGRNISHLHCKHTVFEKIKLKNLPRVWGTVKQPPWKSTNLKTQKQEPCPCH